MAVHIPFLEEHTHNSLYDSFSGRYHVAILKTTCRTAEERTSPSDMAVDQFFQAVRIEWLISYCQVFQRHFGPGGLLVPAGGPQRAENSTGQFAGTLAVSIATEDHHQFLSMDSGDEDPVDLSNMIEKIGDYHQYIRTADLTEMGIVSPFGILELLQGKIEIAQFRAPEVGEFKLTDQIPIGDIEEVAEGDTIGEQRFLLEILSIDFYAVKKRGGQRYRRFHISGAQILDDHRRSRPVIGANIDTSGLPLVCAWMMIDDHIKIDLFKTGEMIRLGID